MKLAYATLIFVMLATISFGQQLIPESLTPREQNEFGDPITNVIDANGARQGDWVYQDIFEKPIVKEVYVDHALKGIFYPIQNLNGTTDWKPITDLTINLDASKVIKKVIEEKHGELAENQQIVLLFNAKGEMIRFAALGIWKSTESQKIEKTVRKILKNNQITISDETFILL